MKRVTLSALLAKKEKEPPVKIARGKIKIPEEEKEKDILSPTELKISQKMHPVLETAKEGDTITITAKVSAVKGKEIILNCEDFTISGEGKEEEIKEKKTLEPSPEIFETKPLAGARDKIAEEITKLIKGV